MIYNVGICEKRPCKISFPTSENEQEKAFINVKELIVSSDRSLPYPTSRTLEYYIREASNYMSN